MFCFTKTFLFSILLAFLLLLAIADVDGKSNPFSKIMKPGKTQVFMRKMSMIHTMVTKVQVCYSRYLRCSRKLSADFCASPTKRMAFYLWARRLAGDIMNGKQDNYNVTCSPFFIRELLHGSLSPLINSLLRKNGQE